MNEIIIDKHLKIDTSNGAAWQCLKCGFVIEPQWNGHRCCDRAEMYTDKPIERKKRKTPAGKASR